MFVTLSAVTTRAVAFGLLYVLVWEGLLANVVSGVRDLSIGQYCLRIATAVAPDSGLPARLALPTAVVMGAIVTAAALAVAARRPSSYSIKGDPA